MACTLSIPHISYHPCMYRGPLEIILFLDPDPLQLTSYLAYNTRAAGDSGKVHSNVKQRWLEGDPVIKQGMATVAG